MSLAVVGNSARPICRFLLHELDRADAGVLLVMVDASPILPLCDSSTELDLGPELCLRPLHFFRAPLGEQLFLQLDHILTPRCPTVQRFRAHPASVPSERSSPQPS